MEWEWWRIFKRIKEEGNRTQAKKEIKTKTQEKHWKNSFEYRSRWKSSSINRKSKEKVPE